MNEQIQEHASGVNNTGGFLAGLLIGGMAGATAMLLLAPQSGIRTRAKIQRQTLELRDQAVESINDAVSRARVKARQFTTDMREQAEELQERGQDMIDGQKERLYTAVEAGKKVVQRSRN